MEDTRQIFAVRRMCHLRQTISLTRRLLPSSRATPMRIVCSSGQFAFFTPSMKRLVTSGAIIVFKSSVVTWCFRAKRIEERACICLELLPIISRHIKIKTNYGSASNGSNTERHGTCKNPSGIPRNMRQTGLHGVEETISLLDDQDLN